MTSAIFLFVCIFCYADCIKLYKRFPKYQRNLFLKIIIFWCPLNYYIYGVQNPQTLLKNSTIFLLLLDQNWQKKSPTLKRHFMSFWHLIMTKMQFEELNFDEFEEVFKSLKRNKIASFNDLSNSIIVFASRITLCNCLCSSSSLSCFSASRVRNIGTSHIRDFGPELSDTELCLEKSCL